MIQCFHFVPWSYGPASNRAFSLRMSLPHRLETEVSYLFSLHTVGIKEKNKIIVLKLP